MNDLNYLAKEVLKQRKTAGLTQAEAAALCGVGIRFFSELENAKSSLQIGKVFKVLASLGLVWKIETRGQP